MQPCCTLRPLAGRENCMRFETCNAVHQRFDKESRTREKISTECCHTGPRKAACLFPARAPTCAPGGRLPIMGPPACPALGTEPGSAIGTARASLAFGAPSERQASSLGCTTMSEIAWKAATRFDGSSRFDMCRRTCTKPFVVVV